MDEVMKFANGLINRTDGCTVLELAVELGLAFRERHIFLMMFPAETISKGDIVYGGYCDGTYTSAIADASVCEAVTLINDKVLVITYRKADNARILRKEDEQ